MPQYKIQDENFFVVFHDITILEWLDLDLDSDSDRLSISIEVAAAVDDWNGQGKIDAYALDADKNNHQYIYEIWQKLEELRTDPKLKVRKDEGDLLITGEAFHCKIKGLTILQFIDSVGKLKRKNPDETPGMFKCISMSENLIDWNGKGKLTAEELYGDRDNHKFVGAIDVEVTRFFAANQVPFVNLSQYWTIVVIMGGMQIHNPQQWNPKTVRVLEFLEMWNGFRNAKYLEANALNQKR
jgi:hypothetical protein